MSNFIKSVVFQLEPDAYDKLCKLSERAGFRYINGYVRQLVEKHVGSDEIVTPVGEVAKGGKLLTLNERALLSVFLDGPKPMQEVTAILRKDHSNLLKLAKAMSVEGWLVKSEAKYTTGRPATVYEITDLGRLRLELDERKRHEKRDTELLKATQHMRDWMESRKPLRRLPNPNNDPKITWQQAAFDAYVKKFPFYDVQIMKDAVEAVTALKESEFWLTWEQQLPAIEASGWIWPEDGYNDIAESCGRWKPNAATAPDIRADWERLQTEKNREIDPTQLPPLD